MVMPVILKNWVDLVSAFALPAAVERTSSPSFAPTSGSERRVEPVVSVAVRSARLPTSNHTGTTEYSDFCVIPPFSTKSTRGQAAARDLALQKSGVIGGRTIDHDHRHQALTLGAVVVVLTALPTPHPVLSAWGVVWARQWEGRLSTCRTGLMVLFVGDGLTPDDSWSTKGRSQAAQLDTCGLCPSDAGW